MIFVFNLSGFVLAYDNSNEIKVNFSDSSYTLYDYNKNDVYINYKKEHNKEIAEIVSVHDNNILEIIEFETLDSYTPKTQIPSSVGTTSAHNFVRTKKFGLTELKLVIIVEVYFYGSFRQINSIQNKTLSINSTFTTMSFENKQVSVWATNNKFPTTVLHYGYSGSLVAPYSAGADAGIESKLLKSGFSASGNVQGTIYYRRTFDTAGKIDLYPRIK